MDRDIVAHAASHVRRHHVLLPALFVYLPVYDHIRSRRIRPPHPRDHHFYFNMALHCQYDLFVLHIFVFSFRFIYPLDYIRPFGSRASSFLLLFFAAVSSQIELRQNICLSFFLFSLPLEKIKK